MKLSPRAIQVGVFGFLVMVIVAVSGLFLATLVHSKQPSLDVVCQLPDFQLTNQLGRVVSLNDFKGKIWIADIIFTRCAGPCIEMTRTMKSIQDALPPNADVKLVSLTADPVFDTPPILNQYATRFKVNSANWDLLTGGKSNVYGLAIQGLKLAVQENVDGQPDENQFIHTTRFVLVDRHGRLRGAGFESTDKDIVSEVVRAVRQLLKES